MLLVFDLDGTLLDTDRLLRSFAREKLAPFGISVAQFEKARAEDKATRSLTRHATPRTIFRCLEKITGRTYPIKRLERLFLRYVEGQSRRFFYPDVFKVMPRLPGRKMLLTRGGRILQRRKIAHSAIRGLFRKLHVTPYYKYAELKKLARSYDGEIVLVDDYAREHKQALVAVPRLWSVHILRKSGRSKEPFAHKRCFVVKNLQQLAKLLPVISAKAARYVS